MTISAAAVKSIFRDFGAEAVAVLPVPAELPAKGLDAMLADGVGDMTWMADHRSLRLRPPEFFPPGTSIIAATISYAHDLEADTGDNSIRRARYAMGKDYHNVFRKQLRKAIRALLESEGLEESRYRIAVDSAPVLERTLAARAGIGWLGKNGLILIPRAGSYHFLGFVFTEAELEPVNPEQQKDRCGACRRCLDACPTGAIVEGRRVVSTRCISYYTIEHQGVIPLQIARNCRGWWFGCDICQEVCPWNRFATTPEESRFLGHDDEAELIALNEADYDSHFAGRPIRRINYSQFRRNLMVALFSLDRISDARAIHSETPLELVRQQAVELELL